MPDYRTIPDASDTNNTDEIRHINTVLGFPGGLGVATGRMVQTRNPFVVDHFLENALNTTRWTTTETGAGGSKAIAATVANAAGGNVAMVAGATTNNAEELGSTNVGWKPSTMGPIYLEVRAKAVGATEPLDGDFSIGWADAITYASGLPHVVGLTSAYTTDATTEFAGFHYSSIPTSGALFLTNATPVGNYIGIKYSKNGADQATGISSGVAKTSGFRTFAVNIDTSGNATWYIDGNQVYYLAAAVTSTVALTPYIQCNSKASHANTMTIDYAGFGGVVV